MAWRPATSHPSFATDFATAGNVGMFRHSNVHYQPNFNNNPQPFPGFEQPTPCYTNSGVQSLTEPNVNLSYQPEPCVQSNVGPTPQQRAIHHTQSLSNGSNWLTGKSEQMYDRRERVEMDEDFPNYKELRNVFLAKQNEVENECPKARRPSSSRVNYQKTDLQAALKKPPPMPKRKPFVPQTPRNIKSHSYAEPVTPRDVENFQAVSPETSSGRWDTQPKREVQRVRVLSSQAMDMAPNTKYSPTDRNIPIEIHQSDTRPTSLYRNQPEIISNAFDRLGRQRRRSGGLHINVSSPSARRNQRSQSSPRVIVTSNSPKSPQIARYRPDEEEYWQPEEIRPRRASATAMSPGISVRNSPGDQPRRRTSYAEITLGSNSLPRNLRWHNVANTSSPEAKSLGCFSQTATTPQAVNRHEDIFSRNKSQGWNVTLDTDGRHYIHGGTNVSYNPTSQGTRAVHAQYNTPIGLYTTENAQQALDQAVTPGSEAADTIKITGKRSATKPPSATMKAVLREDYIRKMTGANPSVTFYRQNHEYGPGIGPLRQYVEDIIG